MNEGREKEGRKSEKERGKHTHNFYGTLQKIFGLNIRNQGAVFRYNVF